MKLLSIIVPTYNMEKYLEHCLQSFICPDIMEQIEVIVVNDGSTDRSAGIAEQYVEQYPGTFQLIDKENGGHGSTINAGVERATGKYFKTIDADDWVDTDALVKFVKLLDDIDVELIITPFITVDEQTGTKAKKALKLSSGQYQTYMDIDRYIKKNALFMHQVCYRTELLKKIHLKLDVHTFYVDVEYMQFVFPYIRKCVCVNLFLYQYRVNQGAQSCSNAGYIKHRNEHAKVILHCAKYRQRLKSRYQSKELYEHTYKQLLDMTEKQYRIYLMNNQSPMVSRLELERFDAFLKKTDETLYRQSGKQEYIERLRKSHFKGVFLQQLIFKYKQNKGSYKDLDF
jgi:glycosyltransferase involved in cell wall biosynthesis